MSEGNRSITVRAMHDAAMTLTDDMRTARRDGDAGAAWSLAMLACAMELRAAAAAFEGHASEQTRRTLLDSATHIARETYAARPVAAPPRDGPPVRLSICESDREALLRLARQMRKGAGIPYFESRAAWEMLERVAVSYAPPRDVEEVSEAMIQASRDAERAWWRKRGDFDLNDKHREMILAALRARHETTTDHARLAAAFAEGYVQGAYHPKGESIIAKAEELAPLWIATIRDAPASERATPTSEKEDA